MDLGPGDLGPRGGLAAAAVPPTGCQGSWAPRSKAVPLRGRTKRPLSGDSCPAIWVPSQRRPEPGVQQLLALQDDPPSLGGAGPSPHLGFAGKRWAACAPRFHRGPRAGANRPCPRQETRRPPGSLLMGLTRRPGSPTQRGPPWGAGAEVPVASELTPVPLQGDQGCRSPTLSAPQSTGEAWGAPITQESSRQRLGHDGAPFSR